MILDNDSDNDDDDDDDGDDDDIVTTSINTNSFIHICTNNNVHKYIPTYVHAAHFSITLEKCNRSISM